VIAITFALPAESSALLPHVLEKTCRNENGVLITFGKIDKATVELLHTGVGEAICRERMARFLQDRQPSYLISSGFAGALTDELHVGDLLVAKNFSTLPLDLAGKAIASAPLHLGDLYTAAATIGSVEQRRQLAETTGTVAVDMETKFIARACAENAVPMLSLRAISDSPAEPFPAPPEVLFDVVRQQIDFARLVMFFLMHPQRVPALVGFAKTIARARETLAKAIVELCLTQIQSA
jgi:adenosylhomocysteine nucleosidase